MKKIFIIAVTLLLIIGCTNKKEENKEKEYQLKYTQMEEKLMEIAKNTFENDIWLNDATLPVDELTSQTKSSVTIFLPLSRFVTNERYDLSIFVNPKTNEKCDFEESGIQLEFNGRNKETGEYDYSISEILVCGQENQNHTQ